MLSVHDGIDSESSILCYFREVLFSRWFGFRERSRGTVLINFVGVEWEKQHPPQCWLFVTPSAVLIIYDSVDYFFLYF